MFSEDLGRWKGDDRHTLVLGRITCALYLPLERGNERRGAAKTFDISGSASCIRDARRDGFELVLLSALRFKFRLIRQRELTAHAGRSARL